MSGVSKKLMGTTAAGGGFTAIEDVFSTYLYTGNGSTQTITNGIDLAGEGGLVWFKQRNGINEHQLFDTERGQNQRLLLPPTAGQVNSGTDNLVSFNSDGFTLGPNALMSGTNGSGQTMASWTFRKAPRFFDVVTYTGTGAARTVAHNLGIEPGCIIVKATSSAGDWWVYHRSLGATQRISLNATNASAANVNPWNNTEPTEAEFSLSSGVAGNDSGTQYVAYLFAHDPLGPSEDGSDGLIACGSFTTDGSAQFSVDLGWEPQWVLMKPSAISFPWQLVDTMRGFGVSSDAATLSPNNANAESNSINLIQPTATGFKSTATADSINPSQTYIYIAIRRGPMRAPESGTEVFATTLYQADNLSGRKIDTSITLDASFISARDGGAWDHFADTRLTSGKTLLTNSTRAEGDDGILTFGAGQTQVELERNFANYSNFNYVLHGFRRAPEFFDVVAYTGDGVAGRTVPHNLGVAPEMMIVKRRSADGSWGVYHAGVGASPATKVIKLNQIFGTQVVSSYWNNTAPTESVFTVGSDGDVNASAHTYIAYLFATLAGVSKVGSYTGNGSSQTIDCGFTTGARFILIKRTDSTGDWYVWDTARGIVAANDPHLSLNTTAAEVTTDDSVDPVSNGFIVNQVAATNINVSAASYIFYSVS